jgi:hypothetical protein
MFRGDPGSKLAQIDSIPKVEIDFSRILSLDISSAETIILICLLAIVGICVTALISQTLKNLIYFILGWNSRIGFQNTVVPDYFHALKMADLEELVEEEKILLFDFGI